MASLYRIYGADKTAIALPFLLARRAASHVVGLTSPRNRAFVERLGDDWPRFLTFSKGWLKIVRGNRHADVERTYREVLEGRAQPHQGRILSLRDRDT